jgi:ferredoxin-NADP reductase
MYLMPDRNTGTIIHREMLSKSLEIFRLSPQEGTRFSEFIGGQHIELTRDHCLLTIKHPSPDGSAHYVYDRDAAGKLKRGPVTHSYSIASAPFETRENGYLEFFVALESVENESADLFSESLFIPEAQFDHTVHYVNEMRGTFTLADRAAGFENVVLVATGTGVAPFVSILKQLNYDAAHGRRSTAHYTMFYASRTPSELGYHQQLLAIEQERRIDFRYVPSVSRPWAVRLTDASVGKGRANNILRFIFGMPLKEERDAAQRQRGFRTNLPEVPGIEYPVRPVLPTHIAKAELITRMVPSDAVVLACGNPFVLDDVKLIAETNGMRFEREGW